MKTFRPGGPKPAVPVAASVPITEHHALPASTRFGERTINRVHGVGGFGIA